MDSRHGGHVSPGESTRPVPLGSMPALSYPAIPHPYLAEENERKRLLRSNSDSAGNTSEMARVRREQSSPTVDSLQRELDRTLIERKQLEEDLVMIKAKQRRLEETIRQVRREENDGTDSDDELPQASTLPIPPPLVSKIADDQRSHLSSRIQDQTGSSHAPIPSTLDSMVSVGGTLDETPPCYYSCFRAGPPLCCTLCNDITTLGCHLWRSFEVTRLASCNLASDSERTLLGQKYNFIAEKYSSMDKLLPNLPLRNFLVWRRSVLLLLLVSSLGALGFAIVGDAWNTYQHMLDMQGYSQFEVSFKGWSSTTMAQLPDVPCEVIDHNFAGKLNSMSSMHQVMGTVISSCVTTGTAGVGAGHQCVFPFVFGGVTYNECTTVGHLVAWCSTGTDAFGNHINSQWGDCKCTNSVDTSCPALLAKGANCEETVDRYVVGCWEEAFCRDKLSKHCPSACTHAKNCSDIRKTSVDFTTFSISFTKATLYKIMELLSIAELKQLFFSICCKAVATAAVVLAALHWADFSQSNRLVLFAWVVTFATPFLRSIVPTAFLIDWKPIDAQLEQFVNVTDKYYDLSTKMRTLKHAAGMECNDGQAMTKMDHSWAMTHHKVHWWCGKVQSGATWFPWSTILRKGAYECQVITNYMGVGDVATLEVRSQKDNLCHMINHTHTDVREGSIDAVSDVIDVAWLRSAAYALVGGMSSLLSFRVVLPEALSIAPGLLTAANRIKVMVPQSYLPGIFIVLMPLLYVPLIWAFCLFIVQGVGDPLLLVAMTCMAFSPLAFTILGFWRGVTTPMSKVGIKAFTHCVQRWQRLLQCISLACLLVYLTRLMFRLHEIQESKKGLSAFLLEQSEEFLLPLLVGKIDSIMQMVFSGPVWSLIFTFMMELYLTLIVGADFMLWASADEWHQKDKQYFDDMQDEGIWDERAALEFVRNREQAMEALLELTGRRNNRKKHSPPLSSVKHVE